MSAAAPSPHALGDERPAVTPFWRRLHKFLALPLDLPVLLHILVLAALCASLPLAFRFGAGASVVAVIVLVLASAYGLGYGFIVAERAALGFLRPSLYPDAPLGTGWLGAAQYVALNPLFVGAWVGIAWASRGNAWLTALVWLLLFVVLLPVATLRLVAGGSLATAVSLAALSRAASVIGLPLLGLFALVFCAEWARGYGLPSLAASLGVGWAAVASALDGKPPTLGTGVIAALFLLSAAFWAITYVLCALIGYVAYQYADGLHLVVIGPGENDRGARTRLRRVDVQRRARDALVTRMVADGDIAEAIARIEGDLGRRPNDLSLHARLHKLLLREGNRARIESHAERCVELLLRIDTPAEAVPLVADVIGRNNHWRPRVPEQVAPLARAALEQGRADVAVHLLRGFDKRHPRHPDLPYVYLLGALAMLRSGGAQEQAGHLLEQVALRYPEHPAAAEAIRHLQLLPGAHDDPPAPPA
ncbi:MAG: hypothetical protein ACK6DI_03665 [Betaproteobacteria bacterium]